MIEIKISQGAKPSHGGVLPAAKVSEEIAQILGVQGQLLSDSSRKIDLPVCGYQCCGSAICDILQHIPTETMFERLTETGAGIGLWPAPFFLNNNLLQPSSFRRVRTRASP